MKDILKLYGRTIWRKLQGLKENPDHLGKVWSNREVRVDAGNGDISKNRPKVKNWNLQVNREAEKPWAKELRATRVVLTLKCSGASST